MLKSSLQMLQESNQTLLFSLKCKKPSLLCKMNLINMH
jgi:hypothetical protein